MFIMASQNSRIHAGKRVSPVKYDSKFMGHCKICFPGVLTRTDGPGRKSVFCQKCEKEWYRDGQNLRYPDYDLWCTEIVNAAKRLAAIGHSTSHARDREDTSLSRDTVIRRSDLLRGRHLRTPQNVSLDALAHNGSTAVDFAMSNIEARRSQRLQTQALESSPQPSGSHTILADDPRGLTAREKRVLNVLMAARRRKEAIRNSKEDQYLRIKISNPPHDVFSELRTEVKILPLYDERQFLTGSQVDMVKAGTGIRAPNMQENIANSPHSWTATRDSPDSDANPSYWCHRTTTTSLGRSGRNFRAAGIGTGANQTTSESHRLVGALQLGRKAIPDDRSLVNAFKVR